MNLSQVNTSSTEYYDVLTSPFIVKKVTINARTPYDEPRVEPEYFTKDYFPTIERVGNKLALKDYNVGVLDLSKASAEIVTNMINQGYSTKYALDTQKAIKAYGLNALNSVKGIYAIENSYEA